MTEGVNSSVYDPTNRNIKCLFNSVVGIATRYWAGRSGNGFPMGARFSAPAQTDSGTHAVSFTMGTGSLQGVKWPGRGVDFVPSFCTKIKERVEVYYGH
jgi:hypothetical protein